MPKTKPLLMGILNLTPDSFSDGGKFNTLDQALRHSEDMISQGADIIDLGGESTRPGAEKVTQQQELDRIIPVLEKLKQNFACKFSVDTSNEMVMRESLALGVDIVNDVRALGQVNDLSFLRDASCKICLMHMQGQPGTMQNAPQYEDVLIEVSDFLKERISYCEKHGIAKERIIIDPGFGFGKRLEDNVRLLSHLDFFDKLSLPILVGISRKSMIGAVTGRAVEQRLAGSLAAMVIAIIKGATYLRVHDVAQSKDALELAWAVCLDKGISGEG